MLAGEIFFSKRRTMNLPKGAFPLTLAVRRLKVPIENTASGKKTPTYRKKKSYKASLGGIFAKLQWKTFFSTITGNVWLQRPLPSCWE